jgi:hypothetical protein
VEERRRWQLRVDDSRRAFPNPLRERHRRNYWLAADGTRRHAVH